MNRLSQSLRPTHRPVFGVPLRILALLLALFVAFTPVVAANAQSRYPSGLRRDRRPTREITIRYPTSATEHDGYIHRSGVLPTFRPGPSSHAPIPNLSDESSRPNDTPNALRPR